MGKVVVVGSVNMDLVVRARHIPKPGETILGEKFITVHGGKGANQAVAAARLGAEVWLSACLGRDAFGQAALNSLQRENINTDHVRVDESEPTGVALITVDNKGENCIVVAPGANAKLAVEDVRKIEKLIGECDVVLSQLETPIETVAYTLAVAKAKGKRTILNPAPARELSSEILKNVWVLTPNETEVEFLTGLHVADQSTATRAARFFHERGVENVIITMGAEGAFVSTPEKNELVPTRKAKVVDTTAAGDVFNAALAVFLSEGKDLLSATRASCLAASLAVEKLGAQSSIPFRKELNDLI